MMLRSSIRRTVAVVLCASLLAAPAMADIKSFNAAVKAGDFKAAAAEAVATWPTLNTARKDLPIIAREFGFAAFMAGDFAAARMFAAEAMLETGEGADADDSRALSAVLLRAAEFRAAQNEKTRAALMAALRARDAAPGFDAISFLAVQALVSHDFGNLDYREALESSAVGMKVAAAGGAGYRLALMRFELVQAASFYAIHGDKLMIERMKSLAERAKNEIDLAASDVAARPFVAAYYEPNIWADAAEPDYPAAPKSDATQPLPEPDPELRSTRLLKSGAALNAGCKGTLDIDEFPVLPKFKGDDRFVATMRFKMDVDDAGRISNLTTVAAMPNAATGAAVADKFVDRWKMKHAERGATCSLARKDYQFTLRLTQPKR